MRTNIALLLSVLLSPAIPAPAHGAESDAVLTRLESGEVVSRQELRDAIGRQSDEQLVQLLREPPDRFCEALLALGTQELIRRVRKCDSRCGLLQNLLSSLDEDGVKRNVLKVFLAIHDKLNPEQQQHLGSTIGALPWDRSLTSEEKQLAASLYSQFLADQSPSDFCALESKRLCETLRQTISDDEEEPEVRRGATKTAIELRCDDVAPILLRLIANPDIVADPPLARSVSKALADLGVTAAIPGIGFVLQSTDDEYVFATAARALARLGGWESLRLLMTGENRFEGGYVAAAVNELDGLVLDLLAHGTDEQVYYAIRATRYLYRESDVAAYKAILKDIASSSVERTHTELALDRLFSVVSREEAREVVESCRGNTHRSDALRRIERLANSTELLPEISTVTPPPETQPIRGNTVKQEYGDPGYRDNAFWWAGLSWEGHTGLCAGIDSGHNLRIIEVGGLTNVVRHNYWSSMQADVDYWGAHTLNTGQFYMTFERRRDVMNTAVSLVGEDIGYPVLPTPDALRHIPSPGTSVSPSEITHLRCDGLVEYAYEWNNLWVWGKNGANYDISQTEYVAEHNDFYDFPFDPNTELAPIVQSGLAGGSSSRMIWAAQTDDPSYVVDWWTGGGTVTLTITASDRSGIHRIGAKIGAGDWFYSPTQPQHPNSESYPWQFDFSIVEPTNVYFFAEDNGDNRPTSVPFVTVYLPPSVSTNAASGVTQTSATMNAAVNPNGDSTTAWFEYGATTDYGSTTPSGSIGSGTDSISFARSATALQCGTTFHFRAVAQNAGGVTLGDDRSFSTLACSCPDLDADGYAECDGSCNPDPGDQCTDCDDGDWQIKPGGRECLNNKDDDCDGQVDEGTQGEVDGMRWTIPCVPLPPPYGP